MPLSARRAAFNILKAVSSGAYADVALQRYSSSELSQLDRNLVTELAYGTIRRQRTLDALITQFAAKSADKQPPELRWILELGLYQLRYLTQIPPSAAVHSTVELAKEVKLGGLAKVVNGILRQYQRQSQDADPLTLPANPVKRLGTVHSYPDWIIQLWIDQVGEAETQLLCEWMSQSPILDLRVNPLRTSVESVQVALHEKGIESKPMMGLPQALRLQSKLGRLVELPGFQEGHWMVQDASAQLVSHVLDPQPGWRILDLCAAPGGKTLHLSEIMGSQGQIIACDPTPSRLKRIQQNLDRLDAKGVTLLESDGRSLPDSIQDLDGVLVDAPCSGLGTLHRHADARWRQTPESVTQLSQLQFELLSAASSRVKSGGRLVYATCTLHPTENEAVIHRFMETHPEWRPDPLAPEHFAEQFKTDRPGQYKVWPHRHDMDGFFLTRLKKT